MKPYKIKELTAIISAEIIGNPDGNIEQIYFDSRAIYQPKNAVFFAFSEFGNDGHSYIEDAYRKGIRQFVISKDIDLKEDAAYLKVNSPIKALQKWAGFHRNQFQIPIVGITGSNGKTIVKEWLNQLLWKDFSIVRSPKSYNSQIGAPLSVLQITAENNLGIFEAGISLPNEMQTLEEIIQPEIGVLTHMSSAHLENFDSKENLIREKIKLFQNSNKIIYNSDNELIKKLIEEVYADKNKEFYTFGKNENDTIQLISINEIPTGKEIKIRLDSNELSFKIPFHDEASVENILTVLTTIHALELELEKYLPETEHLLPIEMRLEIKEGIRESVVINDTFNSDLHSVKVALDVLAQQPFPRKSLVLTDVLQSNLNKDELYRKVSDLVNSYKIDDLILIGEFIPKYKNLFKSKARTFATTDEFLKTLSVQNVHNEAILLKGARPFKLEKISAFLEKKSHDTVLEINLQALTDNVKFFRNKLNPKTKLMAMIKANSYGAGSFEIAQTLEHLNIDYLGAAYADEGAELRKAGITLPIMVMNPEQSSYSTIIEFQLEPEIYSLRVLELFIQTLKEKSITEAYPVHLKIDTGMNRLGFRPEQLDELIQYLKTEKSVKVQSVFTHLATADVPEEKEFALQQLKIFDESYSKISSELNIQPLKHALNSPGIIHFNKNQYDMVRLGIGMYGISDDDSVQKQLKNVITFKTVISRISEIEAGETVSYGRRFKAEKQTKIATLPVGYADGIRRSLGYGIGNVLIQNQVAPIVGTICMDMLMVDVSEINCKEGDEVILFGQNPSIKSVAEKVGTIPYEILTSISARVKRVYYKE
ncbi:bifunctional UDP-N-acetylmuramoyl-tripeptide:D-alanyl-D-alanine ligase/alanine racemase [Moheibacter sediminis]|uniref:Alanine racemase n=1 Tax=Moheibacter sediminis TaxID=1434700 RepID=A0A1W1YCX9_9FLAO|nr:bifunctional UDP-N-acetylmuramoyl-tripeptide:D-alanyl-D-alanine ligase/alanine racemase [Moheibacter sediminis]SMC33974.1 UDP-N-acetylmuramoyl-tripeptide--D-alanyl-D-alanine ligase [Moheibacter sediminis]